PVANYMRPKAPDIRRNEQYEDKRLRKKHRAKHARSGNSTNKESCQKETEDAAIEHRTQNVTRFDQIFDQTGERGDSNSNKTPCSRQRFGRYNIMMVARVWPNQGAIEVDRRGRNESI